MTFPTDAAYRRHAATSFTRHIKPMVEKSPAHSQWRDTHPSKDTSSRAFLSAVHCLALEPHRFADEYAVCTIRRDARTKAYQAFLADNEGKGILSVSEHERAVRIADKLRSHPLFAAALNHPAALIEHAYRWDDPTVGESKGKADLIIPGLLTLDLKTYRSDDPARVGNDMCGNAWDVQLSWYERGYELATGADMSSAARVTVVAVEGTGDYEGMVTVGWFEHSDAMRAVGDARLQAALDRLAECRASGVWPSPCPDEGAVIDPPRWAVLAAGLDPDEVYTPNITITALPDNN